MKILEEIASGGPILFPWWIALALLALGPSARAVVKGLTAEAFVRKACHEDVLRVRETAITTEVWPALAAVSAKLQSFLPKQSAMTSFFQKGQAGDPEIELVRVLKTRNLQLANPIGHLEASIAPVLRSITLHARLVANAKHQAWAGLIASLPILYFGVKLVVPSWFASPIFSSWEDALAAFVWGVGWAWLFNEWLIQVSALRTLSEDVRNLKQVPGGLTS